jgi:hypothetical protein
MTGEQWREIYMFDQIAAKHAKPLSLWGDFEDNVHLTLEWLCRKTRKGDLKFREESLTNLIVDDWYTQEWAEGMLYHVCDPSELLKFRAQYGMVYEDIVGLADRGGMLKFGEAKFTSLSNKWSSMWNLVGRDGMMKHWDSNYALIDNDIDFDELIDDRHNTKDRDEHKGIQFFDSGIGYRFRCSKCTAAMPKGVESWVKIRALGQGFQPTAKGKSRSVAV